MSHTPGPWRTNFCHDEITVDAGSTDDALEICQVYEPSDCDPEGMEMAKGDAHLIAAAPELFEALMDLIGNCERIELFPHAIAAIAKAEGRS